MRGRVFEIREFCLHDGPGPRTTVFLQGCPLRCAWCQNPEGQEFSGGKVMTADEVASEVLKTADFLRSSGGGVTFSGGEPLGQPDFLLAVRARLSGLHAAVETSGFAAGDDYRRVVDRMDLVYQDVKFADAAGYRRWTGADGAPVFANLSWLVRAGRPFVVRVPLIPGVNDDARTKAGIARLVAGACGLQRVELLPYNRLAGAKYRKLGRRYEPGFDETAQPDADCSEFAAAGVAAVAL
ncbi:MAG: radical SAM protein [Kiritimatiellia bacterium]